MRWLTQEKVAFIYQIQQTILVSYQVGIEKTDAKGKNRQGAVHLSIPNLKSGSKVTVKIKAYIIVVSKLFRFVFFKSLTSWHARYIHAKLKSVF